MKLYKVKKSNIDNRGLYAARNIKKDAIIIHYKGKLITKKETDRNPKYDNEKAIYLFNVNTIQQD
jgi:SET domain-containing protein